MEKVGGNVFFAGLAWYITAGEGGAVWDWQVAGRRVSIPYLESEWKWLPSFRCPAGCESGGQGCMTVPMLSVGLEAVAGKTRTHNLD